MMTVKSAVIYTRVSTDRQAEKGISLDNQYEACQKWATDNNVAILRTFREEGVSAKTLNRPMFRELVEFVRAHSSEVDFLIIYAYDRLSRNTADYLTFNVGMKKLGVQIKTIGSRIDDNSPADELVGTVVTALGNYENSEKAMRVREAMKKHAVNGTFVSKAPYGLKNARTEDGRPIIIPVPPVSEKITNLLNEFATGTHTRIEILKYAWRIGLAQQNGKRMSHQSLDKILKQPLYAGLQKNSHTNNELIPTQFNGLVSQDTYHRIQDIISGKSTKNRGYNTENPLYPLRRFVECVDCNTKLRGSASTGRAGKRYSRYSCKCPKTHVKPELLHEEFQMALSGLEPNKLTQRFIKNLVVRVWNDEVKKLRLERAKLQARLESQELLKVQAIDKFVRDDISLDEKISIYDRADKEIREYTSELSKIKDMIGTKQEAVDYVLDFMSNLAKQWNDASPELKVKYQQMIFPEGLKYDFKAKKFGTAKTSPFFTLVSIKKDPSIRDESLLVNHTISNWNRIWSDIGDIYKLVKHNTVVYGFQ